MSHAKSILFFAHCADAQETGFGGGVALNFEGDKIPEWIQLLPRGPELRGHDGRKWTLSDPQALVTAFNARGLTLPVDICHSTFHKGAKGEDAPAVGWIEAMEVRNGEIHGRVAWNARGQQAVRDREYRYISPTFTHDRAGNVAEFKGAGLVNVPNFTLPALNSETHSMFKDLLKKLGLAETATETDAIAAVDRLQTSLNAQKPDLNLYVPRADYTLALNRAQTAEQKLNDQAKTTRDAEVAALIDGAIKAGKVAPASKDFYVATCASEEGLAAFRKHVETLPKMFEPSGLDSRSADSPNTALNASEQEVVKNMGLTPEAYLAARPKN